MTLIVVVEVEYMFGWLIVMGLLGGGDGEIAWKP
jgi:hypothetical protein